VAANRSTREIIDALKQEWDNLPSFSGGSPLSTDSTRDMSLRDLVEVVDQLDKRLRAIEDKQ
jgi:hypothetical protein